MPIFRYRCAQCGTGETRLVPRFDAEVRCEKCGEVMTKQPSAFAAVSRSAASGCAAADFCQSAGGHCCNGHCGCGGH